MVDIANSIFAPRTSKIPHIISKNLLTLLLLLSTTKINAMSDTFTPFSKLATELQLKIWGYAIHSPHIMRVKVVHPKRNYVDEQHKYDAELFTPPEEIGFCTCTR